MSKTQQKSKVAEVSLESNTDSKISEESKCQIQEILQYTCEMEPRNHGHTPQIHCYPIPRIFRVCPNRPAVEITRSVFIDPSTGEVVLPSNSTYELLKFRPVNAF
ncbi:uncharacterized protein FOMMEDRAFT_79508 [Fomitiporia mediterranea MF3/22]|uniref:uncharacterized protein n=1 Tax=Fomitiporia mediterranea (strain MF3/22) TaxID=694068 RepID=UPI0004409136|nr:uncharacterized protein FOMMEDRAFT_79508 [Fomitiporia mediterranea MF3/22]EJD05572.1 hypothetical protein FOMMEDRAFT_79508 [Fomitiporia mediterranea MF3/22]